LLSAAKITCRPLGFGTGIRRILDGDGLLLFRMWSFRGRWTMDDGKPASPAWCLFLQQRKHQTCQLQTIADLRFAVASPPTFLGMGTNRVVSQITPVTPFPSNSCDTHASHENFLLLFPILSFFPRQDLQTHLTPWFVARTGSLSPLAAVSAVSPKLAHIRRGQKSVAGRAKLPGGLRHACPVRSPKELGIPAP
jgi:hypothetical protein